MIGTNLFGQFGQIEHQAGSPLVQGPLSRFLNNLEDVTEVLAKVKLSFQVRFSQVATHTSCIAKSGQAQ